ncbi:hypothetical protein AC578_6413 [Pseudocercospora eumusae]|uniref:Uncharacterized protein n=1 Tax=Pseudocercospora eumusae TaxID=321146 RepID=A0A139H6U7_9PEZI|nr:hypothetical protein AC578_6413 [Pseudocercospora eumusae]
MAYCYRTTYGRRVCRGSRWGNWGRWVLLGVVIGVGLLIALLFACISARRRRKNGRKPFYGTGWAARGPVTYNPNATENKPSYAEQGYYGNQNQFNNPPAYGNNTGGAANDYYGNSAQPGTYQPPQYPPPAAGRNDGVVR